MYDYSYLRKSLKALVISLHDFIPEIERYQISEFIDANELGEAFLLLVDLLKGERKCVTVGTLQQISELGRRMNLDDALWKDIPVE